MNPFWDKLIWMVIDKVLLAGAGALIAYFAARSLERYRRDQAMVLELGKARAQAFARLMALLGEHAALIMALAGGVERTEDNMRWLNAPDRTEQFRKELYTTIVPRNRFKGDWRAPPRQGPIGRLGPKAEWRTRFCAGIDASPPEALSNTRGIPPEG